MKKMIIPEDEVWQRYWLYGKTSLVTKARANIAEYTIVDIHAAFYERNAITRYEDISKAYYNYLYEYKI